MNTTAEAIATIVHNLYSVDVEVRLERPDPQFGDYATSVALQLAKQVGKNPREIATEIADALRDTGEYQAVEVAGPGFINITLGGQALLALTREEPAATRAGEQTVIETNNPNPFKAMHIGHGFNAVLGDTIANLLAVSGARVHRVSYHGDVGLHVGRSMYSLLRYAGGDFANIETIPVNERNSFMSKMYADGSRAYKESAEAKAEINKLAEQSFAPGDGLYGKIYELCKDWSFAQIDTLVARLGNVPIERRFLESAADVRGVATVRANVPAIFQESDGGALVFRGSEHGSFDNVFVGSNGRGLYAARDLGLMQLKDEAYAPVHSYIVTAEEQRDYFKGVIAAAGLIWPDKKGATINISTGTVKLSTGKMSSRDGDVVEIAWLFDEFARAIEARGGDADEKIVAGALRYQFLKVKVGSDVIFDINEAVSLTGNTGSYLQYAHARARRILEKATATVAYPTEVQNEDRALVRKLGEYHEVVTRASTLLEPHHICTYLFELAQEFNRYYEKNQVVGDELEAHRVGLVAVYADILKAGLSTLGIYAPEKM